MRKRPLLAGAFAIMLAASALSLGSSAASASVAKTTSSSHTVLAVRGAGNATTHRFTITAAPWHVAFTFQCISQSQFGFQVKRSGSAKADHTVEGSGFAASGTKTYKDTGTFTVTIKSADHCEWLLKVTQPKT